jgi:hypothetical protein
MRGYRREKPPVHCDEQPFAIQFFFLSLTASEQHLIFLPNATEGVARRQKQKANQIEYAVRRIRGDDETMKKNKQLTWLVLLAVPFLFSAASFGQEGSDIAGKWSLTFLGGFDIEASGDVHEGGTGIVLGLPTTVQAKSWSDVYNTIVRFKASAGYGVWERGQIVGIFTYARADSELLQVGDVATLPLFALFDQYEEWGIEGGYRHFFITDSKFKPYATISGGVKRIDTINATLSVPDADVVLPDVPFYDKSTVGTFGGDFGMRYDVTEMFAINAELGIHYQGSPKEVEGLEGTGLENLNNAGSRWSVPLMFGLSFMF